MAKAKILLVEDNRSEAMLTKKLLEDGGYEVDWVADGKSAIMKARTHSVDVVLLDLVLPDMDGHQVCRWLKLNEHTKGIPIIIVTARSGVKNKVLCLEAGADDYIAKPYDEMELNARIYACLRVKALLDELKEKNLMLKSVISRIQLPAIADPEM